MSQVCTTCFSKDRIFVLGCRLPPVIKELTGAVASSASESTQADLQPSEKPTEGDVSREAFSFINPLPQWAAEAACSNIKKSRALSSSLQCAET